MYASLSLDYDRAHYNVCKPFARFSLDDRAHYNVCKPFAYDRAHYNVCKPFARLGQGAL